MPADKKRAMVEIINKLLDFFRKLSTRQSASYILMVAFIVLTSIGAGFISPAFGFITAGIACGIFGFLLGLE
jgi:hypothetical protein